MLMQHEAVTGSAAALAPVDGKYQVIRQLGKGAMGTVLEAEDIYLGRHVALKFASRSSDEKIAEIYRQACRTEAAAMARVNHPNVATIHAAGEIDGFPFLVMEYVEGQALSEFIETRCAGGKLPLDVAVSIATEIAEGLGAVHAQGIVHRDVKPANVIIGTRYRVTLVDFGIAQPTDGKVRLSGTPPYIAPEVIQREELAPGLRHRGDIYSLAVIVFELLTGEVPFVRPAGTTAIEDFLRAQLEQKPLPMSLLRPEISAELDAVVARALDADPQNRFDSAEAFARALHESLKTTRRAGHSILVVDDDPVTQRLHRAVMQSAVPDADVVGANDGLIALKLAKTRKPSLILLDLNMPGLDGYELCKILKGTDGLRDVPIVVISGTLADGAAERVLQLGAAEALQKPLRPHDLVGVAERHLRLD